MTPNARLRFTVRYCLPRLLLVGLLSAPWPTAASWGQESSAESSRNERRIAWRSLFDGRQLTNWKSTKFGGEGRSAEGRGSSHSAWVRH